MVLGLLFLQRPGWWAKDNGMGHSGEASLPRQGNKGASQGELWGPRDELWGGAEAGKTGEGTCKGGESAEIEFLEGREGSRVREKAERGEVQREGGKKSHLRKGRGSRERSGRGRAAWKGGQERGDGDRGKSINESKDVSRGGGKDGAQGREGNREGKGRGGGRGRAPTFLGEGGVSTAEPGDGPCKMMPAHPRARNPSREVGRRCQEVGVREGGRQKGKEGRGGGGRVGGRLSWAAKAMAAAASCRVL